MDLIYLTSFTFQLLLDHFTEGPIRGLRFQGGQAQDQLEAEVQLVFAEGGNESRQVDLLQNSLGDHAVFLKWIPKETSGMSGWHE